jgi:uncharacterized cupredoxin-like copper-binding protein
VLKKKLAAALGLGLVTLVVGASTACGSGAHTDGSANADPTVVIDVSLKNLRFTPDRMEVAAGQTVRINVTNMDGTEHDLFVDGLRIEKVGEAMDGRHAGATADMLAVHTMANESGSITFRTEQKGTYRFYCTLPGHEDAGMVGEMTVV